MPALPPMPAPHEVEIEETEFDERVRAIRETVFIQEQRVPVAEEFDELDATARHWLALDDGEAVGTVRLTMGEGKRDEAEEKGPSNLSGGQDLSDGQDPPDQVIGDHIKGHRAKARSRPGRLGRLAVLAAHRRKGLGRALALTVVEAAQEAGLEELEAWVQTWAVEWYEKQGFVVFGPEFDDAGIPHRKARLRLLVVEADRGE